MVRRCRHLVKDLAGDGAAHGEAGVRGEATLWFDAAEVPDVAAGGAAKVQPEPIEQDGASWAARRSRSTVSVGRRASPLPDVRSVPSFCPRLGRGRTLTSPFRDFPCISGASTAVPGGGYIVGTVEKCQSNDTSPICSHLQQPAAPRWRNRAGRSGRQRLGT